MKLVAKHLLFITCLLFTISSCTKKTSSKKSNTSSSTTTLLPPVNSNTGGSGSSGSGSNITPGQCNGTGNEQGIADSGQTINYYKINNPPIVSHGKGDGIVVWSSETDLPLGYSQSMLYTDARLNVRIIPRRQHYGTDSKGVECRYLPQPYGKLQVGVSVRRKEDAAGTGQYHLFDDVAVDCASKVHEFQVPSNTNYPLVIEVKNVKWDWSCKDYENQGYSNVPGVCPWDNVWSTECYQLELQFSTDTTKDIPGLRTYQ